MERIGPFFFFFGGSKNVGARQPTSGSDGQLLNWPRRRRKHGVWWSVRDLFFEVRVCWDRNGYFKDVSVLNVQCIFKCTYRYIYTYIDMRIIICICTCIYLYLHIITYICFSSHDAENWTLQQKKLWIHDSIHGTGQVKISSLFRKISVWLWVMNLLLPRNSNMPWQLVCKAKLVNFMSNRPID